MRKILSVSSGVSGLVCNPVVANSAVYGLPYGMGKH